MKTRNQNAAVTLLERRISHQILSSLEQLLAALSDSKLGTKLLSLFEALTVSMKLTTDLMSAPSVESIKTNFLPGRAQLYKLGVQGLDHR